MTTTIKIEFSSIIDNIETYYLDVEFTGNPHSVDVGEDAGEFWGFMYASTIQSILSCEDTIEWDKTKYTETENVIIDKYLEDNYDDIDDEICKQLN
jgi:hypothetical protein